jgi:anti-anti-sigma regulatory factor
MARRAKKTEAPVQPLSEVAGPPIVLAADLGFAEARALHGELVARRSATEVVLEASQVERMSTAAVLVLISFLNARAERTPPAAVVNPSGAFVDAFSELGLFAALMRMEFRT